MSFILVHVRRRPESPDSPKCPWMVLSSDAHCYQPERTLDTVRRYLTANSRNAPAPFLVVFFNEKDLPESAFKVAGGEWKDLDLKVASPLPENLADLKFDGYGPGPPRYLVTHWGEFGRELNGIAVGD